jgi:hypothetical protein
MRLHHNFSNHHGDLTTPTKVKKTLSSPMISHALNTDSVRQGETIPKLEPSCRSWPLREAMVLAVVTPSDINTNIFEHLLSLQIIMAINC